MGKKVTQYVHVFNEETMQSSILAPGDEVPSWAKDQVVNPKAFATDEELAAADAPADPGARLTADGYEDAGKAALVAEIEARNAERGEDGEQLKKSGNKDELVAVLEADDNA